MKLTTEVNTSEVRMKLFPFLKRNTKWSEVKNFEIVNYGFVGGWGIRTGTKYGTVYNIKGKIGLTIELHNGKKYLIGTQKEEELKRVLDAIILAC